MSIFKVGMQVRVITQQETEHFGDVGRIRNVYDADPHRPFEVDFGDELEEFNADEIEPVILVELATAQPAAPAQQPATEAGVELVKVLRAIMLTPISPDAKVTGIMALVEKHTAALQAELTATRARLATAEGALIQVVAVWKLWNDFAMSDTAAIVHMKTVAEEATTHAAAETGAE